MELTQVKKHSKLLWNYIKQPRIFYVFVLVVYLILRSTLGLSKYVILGYAALLLALGISFETVGMIFFLIAIITYVFGGWLEANNYFSYVYISLVLSVIKYFYSALKDRKIHS